MSRLAVKKSKAPWTSPEFAAACAKADAERAAQLARLFTERQLQTQLAAELYAREVLLRHLALGVAGPVGTATLEAQQTSIANLRGAMALRRKSKMEMNLARIPLAGVPRPARRDFAYLDLETAKVALAEPLDAGGWLLRRRWEPICIGLGAWENEGFVAYMAYGWGEGATWLDAMRWTAAEAGRPRSLVYSATREFDEMILRGQFTNARRAHLPARPADWLGVEPDEFLFENVRRSLLAAPARPLDMPSRDVPARWAAGDEDAVLVHLLRDLVELAAADPLRGGEITGEALAVLTSPAAALAKLLEEQ